jgi:hypothetical protein
MNGNMCKDCIQQRTNELEGKFPKYQLLIFSQNLQFENPIQQFLQGLYKLLPGQASLGIKFDCSTFLKPMPNSSSFSRSLLALMTFCLRLSVEFSFLIFFLWTVITREVFFCPDKIEFFYANLFAW